jgi:hypothetical protein
VQEACRRIDRRLSRDYRPDHAAGIQEAEHFSNHLHPSLLLTLPVHPDVQPASIGSALPTISECQQTAIRMVQIDSRLCEQGLYRCVPWPD